MELGRMCPVDRGETIGKTAVKSAKAERIVVLWIFGKTRRKTPQRMWRREWESWNEVQETPMNTGFLAQLLPCQQIGVFGFFRAFSSVRASFRVLPARCHSKCHSPEVATPLAALP
jgi:hypothetical protein